MEGMMALSIGWPEILLIVLFVMGVIVIPLPGRFMRRRRRRPIVWTGQFVAAPIETIHDVAEAFCEELGRRPDLRTGFLRTLLLRRVGSSIEAGRRTAVKILGAESDLVDEEEWRVLIRTRYEAPLLEAFA